MQNCLQKTIDEFNKESQELRKESQSTLGNLIDEVVKLPDETTFLEILNPHSYRGYYIDLAFESGEGEISKQEVLDLLTSCINKVFEGYKGGDFLMTLETPVWLANEGSCGMKITGVSQDGYLFLEEEVF